MKRLGNIAICLASGLVISASLRAQDLAVVNKSSPGNPYAAIAKRNVFGLLPPPAPPVKDLTPDLPKITLTGIQNVAGDLQVLFKVAAKPGTSAKDQYYTLNLGERQDDIEVVKIDDVNDVVTFNNHGIVQDVTIADAKATGPTGGANPGDKAGMNPALAAAMAARAAAGGNADNIIRFGGQQGGPITTADGAAGSSSGANPPAPGFGGNNSLQNRTYQPEASQMTPESVQIYVAAQHLKAIQENDPTAPIFPPTVIDEQAGISSGGNQSPPHP